MSPRKLLILGLGNPGKDYQQTRHNVGAKFVQLLSSYHSISLKKEDKFSCKLGSKKFPQAKIYLSIPTMYMNQSGQAVARIKKYLNLSSQEILIVHDEMDFPTGKMRFKQSGGHGGHKGLRDILNHLQGDTSFKRLRIGVNHPNQGRDVTDYLLSNNTKKENLILENAMKNALKIIDTVIEGNWQQAIMELHTKKS